MPAITPHVRRQPSSVSQASQGRHRAINVSQTERLVSLIGGGALALWGLRQRSLGGLALAAAGGALVYRGLTGHCELYHSLGVNTAEQIHSPAASIPAGHGVRVELAIIINRSPEDVYRFWRNLENLPRFMRHLASVTESSGTRSRWVARAPLGRTVDWEAEIINDRPNELIAWRSLPGADIDTAGSVHFQRTPSGSGTQVHVNLKYNPPGGSVGASVARLCGEAPEQQIQEDLRHFKQLLETGQVARMQGGPR